jgi:transcriptional regulator with XRE-family HTH domain
MEQVISYPRTGTPTLTPPLNRNLNGNSRRQELASFLRSRRESLSPEATGIPRTLRRRVRGLRREEVAEAAGISTAWYTWIEQARDLNLSIATLDSIGRALHLNAEEREHLFQLAGQNAPLPTSQQDDLVMTPLREMLRGMEPNPALPAPRLFPHLIPRIQMLSMMSAYDARAAALLIGSRSEHVCTD